MSADTSRTYWVEEVRFSLDSDFYGPVAPLSGPACSASAVPTGPTYGVGGSPSPLGPHPVGPTSAPAGEEAGRAGGCALGGGPPSSRLAILAALAFLLTLGRRPRPRTDQKVSRRGQGD